MIVRTIQIWNILDHKTYILSGFQITFENQAIQQLDMFGPFGYQTCPVFRWLLYFCYTWKHVMLALDFLLLIIKTDDIKTDKKDKTFSLNQN